MKFRLSTAKSFYDLDDPMVDRLKKYGLEFVVYESEFLFNKGVRRWYLNSSGLIEISSLDELMAFVKEFGQIVLDDEGIEIYNDYRE